MSLAKFSNRHVHRGKKIHWSRAAVDGLPYRGAFAPMYTQDEFEEKVVKVGDPHAETFDMRDPDSKTAYLNVLDGIVNGWFQCLYIRRWETDANIDGFARIEWVEFFLEDGNPAPFMSPGTMELAHAGAQSLLPASS